VRFPVETLGMGKLNPFALNALGRMIRRDRPDILHLHGYASWTFGRVAGALTGTPVVLQEHMAHGRSPWYQRLADRTLARLPSRAIAVSDTVRDFMRDTRYVPVTTMEVIPNGIPLEGFSLRIPDEPASIRSELGLSAKTLVVGAIGRLDPIKGLDLLLRAFPGVLARVPDVKLLIVGEGPSAAGLRGLAEELGVSARVDFLGHRQDVPRLLSALDVFAVPSLSEGFCIAAVEAMAAGKAILSSDCSALRQLLQEGASGLLFQSGDFKDLEAKLVQLLGDERLRVRLADRARERSRDFDVREAARAYKRLYSEIVEKNSKST
jgi:glycosyltransferase involved in cell wall biosynthesis